RRSPLVARSNAMPYPLQVDRYVREVADGHPFSAKDVYGAIEHPDRHDPKASIAKIHQSLVLMWADQRLVSFVDGEGKLLEERAQIASKSAAVEHPQLFALPGTAAPEGGRPLSKSEYDAAARAAARHDLESAPVADELDAQENAPESANEAESESETD